MICSQCEVLKERGDQQINLVLMVCHLLLHGREEGKGRRREGGEEKTLENHFTVLNVYSLSTVIAGIDKKGGIRFYRSIQTRASKG